MSGARAALGLCLATARATLIRPDGTPLGGRPIRTPPFALLLAVAGPGLFAGTATALVDTTPPVINLYPLPPVTDEAAVDVRGTVADVSPCNVTVNGIWALVEAMTPGNATQAAPLINRTIAGLEVLPPTTFDIARYHTEILAAWLLATAAEGSVVAFQIVRFRRRMSWDRAYL